MKSFKLLSLFLAVVPLLSNAADCSDSDPCDPGWVMDENCFCVQRKCPGVNRDYIDAATNQFNCCPSIRDLVIYDEALRTGVCCPGGQNYLGAPPNGKCCDPDQTLVNGECFPPKEPPTGSCGHCPQQPLGVCNMKAACGTSTDNGLQYGKCYQITFIDGKQLGRGTGGAHDQYISQGYIQNIPYKICKTPAACGTGNVKPTDTFVIEDEVGPADTANAGVGWVGVNTGGGHMSLTTDPALAAKFKGSMGCSDCKCIVHVTGDPDGFGLACPMDQAGISFWPNQKVGLDLQFAEIPCDGNFAAWEGR